MTFEHIAYLSDGTKLSQAQYDELMIVGKIVVANRILTADQLHFRFRPSETIVREMRDDWD
jgi:hypothetical protein